VDEEAVKKLTGQAQVPVLLVNGTVIRLDRHLELA
jgi:glutaredoxin